VIFTVIQPGYFPVLPVYGKIMAADKIVWADSFVYNKHSRINRTQIKTITGAKWLTIPVFSPGNPGSPIHNIRIDNHENWMKSHQRSIALNYKNAAYYYYFSDDLENQFAKKRELLNVFLRDVFDFTLKIMCLKKEIYPGKKLPEIKDRTDRIISWANELECDTFIIEPFEHQLVDIKKIQEKGIRLLSFQMKAFNYFQEYGKFLFPLSILDLLFHEGENALSLISTNCSLADIKTYTKPDQFNCDL